MAMTDEQFDNILKTLEELKQNDYHDLNDEHYNLFEQAKEHALQQSSTNKSPIQKLIILTQTASQEQIKQNRQIEADGFNLDTFYDNLSDEMGISRIQGLNYKIEDRGSSPFVFKQTEEIEAEAELKEAYAVLDNLRNKNNFFNDALKDKNVTIKILNDTSADGRFIASDYKRSKGKDVVVTLNKGCFDEKNKSILPMLIAHEFGHFIDVSNRPEKYTGGLKDKEEFFVDAIGLKMAVNSGYENSVSQYITLLNQHNNDLSSARALKLRFAKGYYKLYSISKHRENQAIEKHSPEHTSIASNFFIAKNKQHHH